MQLHTLRKITKKKLRRLGQGHGSGRVKTSGRGTKGQKARRNIPIQFEGGAVTLIKRLPFRRGKGRNKVFKKKPIAINVSVLNLLPKGSIVDIDALVNRKIVDAADAKAYGIKVLGNGQLTQAVTVSLPLSKQAAEKIKKAGGTVTAS